jgi:hypothetical protein
MNRVREAVVETLTLFGSLGTLLCCALPALLVSIGAGAAMASIVTSVPQLVWISEHKVALFIFAGAMIAISGVTSYRNRHLPCPTDPAGEKRCRRVRRWSTAVFLASAFLYAVGFYFAFLAAHFRA